MLKFLLILLFSFSYLGILSAQDKNESKGKFHGLAFGDYYYFIDDHKSDLVDQRGFWFRRIYFTYDYTMNKQFSSRLRLEMSNEGDFTSKVAIVPVVKDAWLKYKFSNQEVILGISPTPTFQIIEKVWNYRSVEKTPLDLQRMASSRDFGIAGKGKFDDDGMFRYHLMFSNGSSNKQEVDKGKSGMLSLSMFFSKVFVLEVYGDYADNPGDENWYTLQGFFGYNAKKLKAGLQYSAQTRQLHETTDTKLQVLSFFASGDVSDHISLLGRVDKMFEPNPEGNRIAFLPFNPTASSLLVILGVDYHPIPEVKLIPNIEFIKYSENKVGNTPPDDLVA
ncbi:MAG: hypothetical protein P8X73_17340, partial [Ignavibacteriaceae bacterium]